MEVTNGRPLLCCLKEIYLFSPYCRNLIVSFRSEWLWTRSSFCTLSVSLCATFILESSRKECKILKMKRCMKKQACFTCLSYGVELIILILLFPQNKRQVWRGRNSGKIHIHPCLGLFPVYCQLCLCKNQ